MAGASVRDDGWQLSDELDLRRRDLANRVFDDLGAVVDACCAAWNRLIADPGRLTSLTAFAWARSNPKTS